MKYFLATEINVHVHVARPSELRLLYCCSGENDKDISARSLFVRAFYRFSSKDEVIPICGYVWSKWKWTIPLELSRNNRNRQSNRHIEMSSCYKYPPSNEVTLWLHQLCRYNSIIKCSLKERSIRENSNLKSNLIFRNSKRS